VDGSADEDAGFGTAGAGEVLELLPVAAGEKFAAASERVVGVDPLRSSITYSSSIGKFGAPRHDLKILAFGGNARKPTPIKLG
jgi:hypothetical protein